MVFRAIEDSDISEKQFIRTINNLLLVTEVNLFLPRIDASAGNGTGTGTSFL